MKCRWILLGVAALVGAGLLLISWNPLEEWQKAGFPMPEVQDVLPPRAPSDLRAASVREALQGMTLEEKVGQVFLARCPSGQEAEIAAQYQVGGYLLFGRDFENRTPDMVRKLLQDVQSAVKIPMLLGVDEEGGTVCRVSAYPQYRESRFASPQKLYREGGLDAVRAEAAEKAALLKSLGLNLNLAPVCDVSENPNDFMYSRTLGQGGAETAQYVRAVVQTNQSAGMGSVLKHFPGYGSNVDTHTGSALDERPYEQFEKTDFLPFAAGIEAGAGCVLVSHNVVACMDEEHPASLSSAVYRVLRRELGFQGVAVTDDLAMDAIAKQYENGSAAVQVLRAGGDLIISSDLESQYQAVLEAVQAGELSKRRLEEAVSRVLGLKYDLGLSIAPQAPEAEAP